MNHSALRLLPVVLATVLGAGAAASQQIQIEEVWAHDGPAIPWLAGLAEVGDGYWALSSLSRDVQFIPKDGGAARPVPLSGVDGPLLLGAAPGGAAVYDGENQTLKVFRQGAVRATIPLDNMVFFPKTMLAVDDSTVILAAGIGGSSSSIHIFRAGAESASAHLLALPETTQPIVGRMIAGGVLASDGDGGVLFAQSSPHLIARLDVERAALDTIVSDPSVLPAIGDGFRETTSQGQNQSRWFFPQARGVGRLADGRIFHLIRHQEEGRSIWEVYEPDGTLVARTTVDRAYDVWSVLDDGTLLASRFTDGPNSLPVRLRIAVVGAVGASRS